MDISPEPIASVLMPTRDGAETIGRALDALRGQVDAPPFEVVLVDDHSRDGTADVVRRHASGLDLRLLPASGRGLIDARNQLASVARADLLLFCDDDDEVGPRWVAAHVEVLGSHEMSTGPLEALAPGAPWMLDVRPVPEPGELPWAGKLPFAFGANLGIRRASLEAIGGWGQYAPGEDVHVSWSVQERGGSIGQHPDAVVRYRLRTDLRGLWRQQVGYAAGGLVIDRIHGVRPNPRRLRIFGWLVRHLHWARSGQPERRARWVLEAATAWGRLRGARDYRTWPF